MSTELARSLRKNMTLSEISLWKGLRARALGVKFRRQAPIGPYFADFICFEKKLIIEVDGEHHVDSEHDERRDACTRAMGFTTLRFWNNEVLRNRAGVLERILEAVEGRSGVTPTLPSPLQGEDAWVVVDEEECPV